MSPSLSSQSLPSLPTYISSLYSYLKGAIVASTGLAVLLSVLLFFKQSYVIHPRATLHRENANSESANRDLIYPRSLPAGARTTVPTPDQFGIHDWETVALRTPDGETLSSYLLKSSSPSRRSRPGATVRVLCVRRLLLLLLLLPVADISSQVLFMHGNAGNIVRPYPPHSSPQGCADTQQPYRAIDSPSRASFPSKWAATSSSSRTAATVSPPVGHRRKAC